jgi:hypothetical protein
MNTVIDPLTAARAEALFTSDLPTGSHPTRDTVTAAISRTVRMHHGIRSCATVLAYEYGEHPETAAPRMRWARQTIETAYAHRSRLADHRRPPPCDPAAGGGSPAGRGADPGRLERPSAGIPSRRPVLDPAGLTRWPASSHPRRR